MSVSLDTMYLNNQVGRVNTDIRYLDGEGGGREAERAGGTVSESLSVS